VEDVPAKVRFLHDVFHFVAEDAYHEIVVAGQRDWLLVSTIDIYGVAFCSVDNDCCLVKGVVEKHGDDVFLFLSSPIV